MLSTSPPDNQQEATASDYKLNTNGSNNENYSIHPLALSPQSPYPTALLHLVQKQIQQLHTHTHIKQIAQVRPLTYKLIYHPQGVTSLYSHQLFQLKLVIPESYPEDPPFLYFLTKTYHLNVHPLTGQVFMGILVNDWSSYISLKSVLISLDELLDEPDEENPATQVMLELYLDNLDAYVQNVRDCCIQEVKDGSARDQTGDFCGRSSRSGSRGCIKKNNDRSINLGQGSLGQRNSRRKGTNNVVEFNSEYDGSQEDDQQYQKAIQSEVEIKEMITFEAAEDESKISQVNSSDMRSQANRSKTESSHHVSSPNLGSKKKTQATMKGNRETTKYHLQEEDHKQQSINNGNNYNKNKVDINSLAKNEIDRIITNANKQPSYYNNKQQQVNKIKLIKTISQKNLLCMNSSINQDQSYKNQKNQKNKKKQKKLNNQKKSLNPSLDNAFQQLKQTLCRCKDLISLFTQECQQLQQHIVKIRSKRIKAKMQERCMKLEDMIMELFDISQRINMSIMNSLRKVTID